MFGSRRRRRKRNQQRRRNQRNFNSSSTSSEEYPPEFLISYRSYMRGNLSAKKIIFSQLLDLDRDNSSLFNYVPEAYRLWLTILVELNKVIWIFLNDTATVTLAESATNIKVIPKDVRIKIAMHALDDALFADVPKQNIYNAILWLINEFWPTQRHVWKEKGKFVDENDLTLINDGDRDFHKSFGFINDYWTYQINKNIHDEITELRETETEEYSEKKSGHCQIF